MKSLRLLAMGSAALLIAPALLLMQTVPATHAASAAASSAQNTQPSPSGAAGSAPPTWAHDVAPVIYNHCTTCHHQGGAGPFSLLSYAEAKRWAPQILNVTQSRFMPPWLPEPGYGDFADVRRLPDSDRALLKRWIDTGMALGDAKAAPTAPQYDNTWQMGKPDLVLKVERPFTLPAGDTDVFRNLILPYPLKQTHYIRAMEIKPGAPQVVHHANVLVDRSAAMRHAHPDDWQSRHGAVCGCRQQVRSR
jgi:mono/diheme cytochrome c family protein